MPVALPTRKHCSRCTRWLVCAIHFRPAERRGDCIVRLQSQCNGCVRERTRVRVGRLRRGVAYNPRRPAMSRDKANWKRRSRMGRIRGAIGEGDPLLPIGPLRHWLNEQIMTNGIAGVARQMDADPEYLTRIWRGVYWNTSAKRWGRQHYVRLSLVDRWVTLFGGHLDDLYTYEEPRLTKKEEEMATQAQFEAAVADRLGIPKKEAVALLEDISTVLFQCLKAEGLATIRGIGRFKINDRKARMGRNPQTGEQIRIKASKKLRVTPNKALKDRLKVK
jgi:DNA-binding protein HU-beta